MVVSWKLILILFSCSIFFLPLIGVSSIMYNSLVGVKFHSPLLHFYIFVYHRSYSYGVDIFFQSDFSQITDTCISISLYICCSTIIRFSFVFINFLLLLFRFLLLLLMWNSPWLGCRMWYCSTQLEFPFVNFGIHHSEVFSSCNLFRASQKYLKINWWYRGVAIWIST